MQGNLVRLKMYIYPEMMLLILTRIVKFLLYSPLPAPRSLIYPLERNSNRLLPRRQRDAHGDIISIETFIW
jgi:hypothetical protein